jgi:probable F420-dependent oxidoreductase
MDMKFGVFSFNTEYSIRPDDLAKAVEERGFESVWFPEHTHIPAGRRTPYPGGGDLPKEYIHMADPLASAAAAAAVTKRIKIGTGICLVPQHDPIVLAKTVATIDWLSNGRFLFGIGAGWNEDEMENHGVNPRRRWKVAREHIEAMRRLWTEEEASYDGEFVRFERVWSYPKPVTRPHPPIILGTFASGAGRQRVADFGDGWIPVGLIHGAGIREDIVDLHERLRKKGRDPRSVPISMLELAADTPADTFARYRDMGTIDRVVGRVPTTDRDSVLKWLDQFAETARHLS